MKRLTVKHVFHEDTFSSSFSILYFVIFPLFQDYLQTVNSPAKTEITLQIDGWILTIFLELREGYPRPNFQRPLKTFLPNVED